jgi:hypothetical protein
MHLPAQGLANPGPERAIEVDKQFGRRNSVMKLRTCSLGDCVLRSFDTVPHGRASQFHVPALPSIRVIQPCDGR